jgi:hypothetical protein
MVMLQVCSVVVTVWGMQWNVGIFLAAVPEYISKLRRMCFVALVEVMNDRINPICYPKMAVLTTSACQGVVCRMAP